MDTIFALSTAPARSGVAVVRISGERAEELLLRVFRCKKPLRDRTMTLGALVSPDGETLDRCLAVVFRGSASYTGEPSAELHLHGSPAVIDGALDALAHAGGRPARAGEFTRRAFLNGKLDLSEAEAVGNLIAAETRDAAKNAAAMLSGALGRELLPAYDALIDLCAHLAAEVDYPEEDVEPLETSAAIDELFHVEQILQTTLDRSDRARAYTEGVRAAIVGAPNAGKSTLFNAVLGERRAIVTADAGTTRDLLRERATLGGVPLILADTAGIREGTSEAERAGVDFARTEAERAELAILLLDGSRDPTPEDELALDSARRAEKLLVALNKRDLGENPSMRAFAMRAASGRDESPNANFAPDKIVPRETSLNCSPAEKEEAAQPLLHGRSREARADVSTVKHSPSPVVRISAERGDLAELESAVESLYSRGGLRFDGTLLTGARQRAAARSALDGVRSALQALQSGTPADLALSDAERAAQSLGELFGRGAAEDVIDRVFENFCVGK